MRLLIDADILVYRAGFAAEGEPVTHAYQALRMLVNRILLDIPHSSYKMFLTSEDKTNFRFEVAVTKPYKGNRKADKPQHYEALRKYIMRNYPTEVVSDIEADDALGINQTDSTCIVTLDKDLDMIPGKHYNFVQNKRYDVNRTEAYRTFCEQLLVGDPVDNIAGAKGIGKVKAKKAISYAGRDKAKMIAIVYDLYDNEELFLEMGKLVWIWREEDGLFNPDLDEIKNTKVQYSTKRSKHEQR